MQIETKITLDMLTADSVSVLTQRFVDGEQLGQNHRRVFINDDDGIVEIAQSLEEPYLSTVLKMWGIVLSQDESQDESQESQDESQEIPQEEQGSTFDTTDINLVEGADDGE